MFKASKSFEICVDCVEFSPDGNYFACGLYELTDGERQRRIGGVDILEIERETDGNVSFKNCANFRFPDCGVLNLRWLNSTDIICALSNGKLAFLKFDEFNRHIFRDDKKPEIHLCDNIILCVESCRFSNYFLTGDSCGFVDIGDLKSATTTRFEAHENFEVWCVYFHHFHDRLFFSGADDCLLKIWDRRLSLACSAFSGKAAHSGGVTSIYNGEDTGEHFIFTGSYDDFLRQWDLRNLKMPLDSLNLGGGVWRIKPNKGLILCACMYNGWSIVERDSNGKLIKKFSDDTDGKHLLYSIDWISGKENNFVCGTFYDKTIRLIEMS